jgi:hypothetical protein
MLLANEKKVDKSADQPDGSGDSCWPMNREQKELLANQSREDKAASPIGITFTSIWIWPIRAEQTRPPDQ